MLRITDVIRFVRFSLLIRLRRLMLLRPGRVRGHLRGFPRLGFLRILRLPGPLGFFWLLGLLLAEGRDHESLIPVTLRTLTIARNITGHMAHARVIKLSRHNSTKAGLAMSTGRGRC
jgi:hypothetical protein